MEIKPSNDSTKKRGNYKTNPDLPNKKQNHQFSLKQENSVDAQAG